MQGDNLNLVSCLKLKGVGEKVATLLRKLNIITVQDLLFHLPLRYEDRTQYKQLRNLKLGDEVRVEGKIMQAALHEGRRKTFACRIQDETGYLTLRFFHFNSSQLKKLNRIGHRICCFGQVRRGFSGFEMFHPEYFFPDEQSQATELADTLTPIYPSTEGLLQLTFKKLTIQAVSLLEAGNNVEDYLPNEIVAKYNLMELVPALKLIHQPPSSAAMHLLQAGCHPAQKRLSFEELVGHQLSLAKIRLKTKLLLAPQIRKVDVLAQQFVASLPFPMTRCQKRVSKEILDDMLQPAPMLRLVQGDVGCGKTVVAALAALYAIESGYQAVLMAPTELLAEQHYRNFVKWYEPLSLNVELLTGSIRGKHRECIQEKITSGIAHLIIGTHALFQQDIGFSNLGLIIIDEQHRFGVDQRLALLNKGVEGNRYPHQLVMSATPIPRTLAMTAYADLDISAITELPPGRKPIETAVISQTKREHLIQRIKEHCMKGAQAYWVCTLIQESDILQCQAAEEVAKELTASLPELKIALVHGRMKPKEKENVMRQFKNNEVNLLVATTVIEVGVDVPNASLMVIENSERLGLSQLHQLRGRVGRGHANSYCVLLYQEPLSQLAKTRLAVIRDSSDGFEIAQQDLELRGPGEMLGTKQTGVMQLKIANLLRDKEQLPLVQQAAGEILQHYPQEANLLIKRWLADNDRFSEV